MFATIITHRGICRRTRSVQPVGIGEFGMQLATTFET
jgi:hypothetical protein